MRKSSKFFLAACSLITTILITSCFLDFKLSDGEIFFYTAVYDSMPSYDTTSVSRGSAEDAFNTGNPLYDLSRILENYDSLTTADSTAGAMYGILYEAGEWYSEVIYSALLVRPFTLTPPFDFNDPDDQIYTHFKKDEEAKKWAAFAHDKETGRISVTYSWEQNYTNAAVYSILRGYYIQSTGEYRFRLAQYFDNEDNSLDLAQTAEVYRSSTNALYRFQVHRKPDDANLISTRICMTGKKSEYSLMKANQLGEDYYFTINASDTITELQEKTFNTSKAAGFGEYADSDRAAMLDGLAYPDDSILFTVVPEGGMELTRSYLE